MEIVITAFFIGTYLSLLLEIKRFDYNIILFPFQWFPIHLPLFYLLLVYKIGLANKRLLASREFYYTILFASLLGIMISLAQIEEIIPVIAEGKKGFIEFYLSVMNHILLYPIFCIILSILLLGIILYSRQKNCLCDLLKPQLSFNAFVYAIITNIFLYAAFVPSVETWQSSFIFRIIPSHFVVPIAILFICAVSYVILLLLDVRTIEYEEYYEYNENTGNLERIK